MRQTALTPLLRPASTTAVLAAFGAALLLVLVVGCSAITRPAPIRQTFLLAPAASPTLANPRPGALRVGAINVAAPFRGKAFVYRMSNLRFETDFYVEFLVPPAAMLTEQTARALEHAKPFAHVALPDGATDADWVLSGFASALYSDARDAGKPAAVLEITYYLTSSSGMEQTPVWTREYRQRVPMANATPSAYAEALNRAFGEIVAALARDLAVAELPKS